MLGWAMGPPEEREYAVLPVGVARIRPSACDGRVSLGARFKVSVKIQGG
jgi:hypothetical protein